ncbi:MAG: hypothetical protein CL459_03365 [Acidimicrobiaceae bacterium]|nr:hypothetical protein [Acidimicrobiaceae bacterium]
MPVAQGVSFDTRRAVLIGLAGLASAVGLLVLMLWLAGSKPSLEVRLGDSDFRGIDAADLAEEIADNGPVPFPDLVGRDRPIWVTHAGADPTTGWFAFFARVPGVSADCLVQWDADQHLFFDSCEPSATFPPDGAGLEQLAWRVEGGELRIAINDPDRD